MSKQLFEDLLASLKRSNKERKLKLAQKAGYKTVDEYKTYLENQINGVVEKPKSVKSKTKPIIHIVDIIDCSGSMGGPKINNAIKGINDGITELKKDKVADYTYTLCDFSDSNDIKFSHVKTPIKDVNLVKFKDRGMTALYDAIGTTLDKIRTGIKEGEKVLVNIYTDGGENGSRKYNSVGVSNLIESLKGVFTVTFIGTPQDVDLVVSRLNIDRTNTLSYDGTAQGLAKGMSVNSVARSSYSASVAKGEDVSLGFYKNIVKK